MNLARALLPERRATARDVSEWRRWGWAGMDTASGETVNETTALAHSAYFACIRNISQDVAKLPLKPYRPMEPRGKEVARNHPSYTLVHDRPNGEMTAITFWETILAHALGWKGGFAHIVFDGAGTPLEMWPLDPNSVNIWRNKQTMELVYEVYLPNGSTVRLPPREVLHIHGLGMDGITAHVIAHINRESIGNALAAQTHSAAFFRNGAMGSGIIEVPQVLKTQALQNLRESFADRYAGAKNHYKPIVLEQNAKWTPIGFDPEKSQLIQTQEFTGKNICRSFRMPPHKAGFTDAQPRANVQEENLSYNGDTLMPWIVKVEQACAWKLLRPGEQKQGMFYKHNEKASLRGNSEQQASFFSTMRQNGIYSTNDIRELLDENPVEDDGGDVYMVNGTMIPLDVAAKREAEMPSLPRPLQEAEPDDAPVQDQGDSRAIDGLLDSHEALFIKELKRLCDQESEKLTRAKKQDRVNERFWEQSRKCATDIIGPLMRTLIGTMDAVTGEPLNGRGDEMIRYTIELHMRSTQQENTSPDRGINEAKTMIEDIRNAYRNRKPDAAAA